MTVAGVLWLPSEKVSSPDHLIDSLCVSKKPFGPLIGIPGGFPDTPYARLDADVERSLIDARAIGVRDVRMIPAEDGVYLVYHFGRLVYIGSTHDLRVRLGQHTKSVTQAKRINVDDVWFKFAAFPDSCAIRCIEGRLIQHYDPEWNGLGFGRRPGKSADRMRPSLWDIKYDRILPVGGVRKAAMPVTSAA